MRRRALTALTVALAVAAAPLLAACGEEGAGSGRAEVVVTTTVLGSVVRDLVGDRADVSVVMPNGADPHEFQPSARDAQAIADADLVVENGLGLEEGLTDTLARARDDGTPIFTATDHVTLRPFGADERAAIAEHGPDDPHVWMDPIAMRQVVAALAPVLRRELGVSVADRATALERRLAALNTEIARELAEIPPDRRKLVTGHESMGYFAARYGLEAIGALIPSLSSQAQVSAASLAALRAQVESEGVPAIFNEAGTPDGVADAIADETGVPVVEVATHNLPEDGSYITFMRDAAHAVAEGLAAPAAGG